MSKKSLGLILGFAAVAVIFVTVFYGKGGTFKGQFTEFEENTPGEEGETTTTELPVPCGQPGQPPCPTEPVPPFPGTPACGAAFLPPCLPGTSTACGREGMPECPADAYCQAGTMIGQGPGPIACELIPPQLPPPGETCSMTNCDLSYGLFNHIRASFATMHGAIDTQFSGVYSAIDVVKGMTQALATDHRNISEQIAGLAHNLATMNEGVVKLVKDASALSEAQHKDIAVQAKTNQSKLLGKLCSLAKEFAKPRVHPGFDTRSVCAF